MNRDTSFTWATARLRNAKHWQVGDVTWGDLCDMVSQEPDSKKESGGYVIADLQPSPACRECQDRGLKECIQRNKRAVVSRGVLTLDADYPTVDFMFDLEEALQGSAYIWHTTYSSTPDAPRYRLIVPLSRTVSPEEYTLLARAVMAAVGRSYWDLSSDEPERYMFRPAAPKALWYRAEIHEGGALDPDLLLETYEDDLSARSFPKPHAKKQDPFTLPGVIGEFNTAYRDDLDGLIAQYELPYVPAGENRWSLAGTHSQAGMGEVEPGVGLFYSYHANDPAVGKTCSAFDLVRLHRFWEKDEDVSPTTPLNRLPSYEAMMELAAVDPRVLDERLGDLDDDQTWQMDLSRNPRNGSVKNTWQNLQLIRDNDPSFDLRLNEMTSIVEYANDPPWSRPAGREITENDRSQILHRLQAEYGLKLTRTDIDNMIAIVSMERHYDPVSDYLRSLRWDGQPRVETALPGVAESEYSRLVSRKAFVGAVARALNPGCKWDYTLILVGPQGLGKTHWCEVMSRGWFGQLGDIRNKDSLLAVARSWIVMTDELHSFRRAEADQFKEFLTRTSDVVRMPYERQPRTIPRRCVVWGTTNDPVFLRPEEGNRRYLPVQCTEIDFTRFTDEFVDQVWAEAVAMYQAGESLFFTVDETMITMEALTPHVEEDTLVGRFVAWLEDEENEIEVTCTVQLWYEALRNYNLAPTRQQLADVRKALDKVPGWTRLEDRRVFEKYGPQQAYGRTTGSGYSDLL